MKKNKLNVVLMAMLILAFLATYLVTSCNLDSSSDSDFSSGPLEITGIWDTSGGTMEFDDNSFTVINPPAWTWDYSGDISVYSNDSYNLPSENPSSGNFGFAVLKITAHTGDPSQMGTFTVLRWKELITIDGVTTMEYSEGYNASVDAFTSAEDAQSGATDVNNFFNLYSSITKQ